MSEDFIKKIIKKMKIIIFECYNACIIFENSYSNLYIFVYFFLDSLVYLIYKYKFLNSAKKTYLRICTQQPKYEIDDTFSSTFHSAGAYIYIYQ